MPNVTFGIYKEVQSSLSRNASETLEQQQDSNPRHAKSTPKKCLTLPLEAIKEDTKPLDDAPSKTAEQQQDSSPRHAKTTPKKCLTLPLESIKENTKLLVLARPRPRKKHTGQNGRAPSKSQKNGVRSKHCQDAFSRRWHGHGQGKNTRVKTAEPHLNRRKFESEASAARMLFVAKPLDAPLPKQPNSSRQQDSSPRKLESPASKAFGGAPPKHSNSNRIRTHATQKAHRKSA